MTAANRAKRLLPRMILALTLVAFKPASAHKESDAYLAVSTDPSRPSELHARIDVALRDLAFVLDLDADHDGHLTWGELKARRAQIEDYVLQRIDIRGDGLRCDRHVIDQAVTAHSDGAYNVTRFDLVCDKDIPSRIGIEYHLFQDIDPYHRGIVTVTNGSTTINAIVGPDRSSLQLDLRKPDPWQQFGSFVKDGLWHIWTGPDHLLFILSLLLPAVFVTEKNRRAASGEWSRYQVPVGRLSSALIELIKVVSGFTVSHSATLTLSVLGYVNLPSRLVESGIALSIIVAAANNLVPLFTGRAWLIAFGFGFIHGLGFASALAGLSLPPGAMALSLGGFSLGVELGQEAVVLPLIPLAFCLRHTAFYRQGVLRGGSVIIIAIASIWLLQRALEISIPGLQFLTPP